jgi:hypothetical protein
MGDQAAQFRSSLRYREIKEVFDLIKSGADKRAVWARMSQVGMDCNGCEREDMRYLVKQELDNRGR